MRFATLICIELEADGRRLRLARNPGEFFLLSCFVARFHELYRSARRRSGFTARLVSDQALAALSAQRRARERRRRERTGHYFPSRIAVRVPGEAGTDDTFVPLSELLGAEHIDPDGVSCRPRDLRRDGLHPHAGHAAAEELPEDRNCPRAMRMATPKAGCHSELHAVVMVARWRAAWFRAGGAKPRLAASTSGRVSAGEPGLQRRGRATRADGERQVE